MTLPRRHFLGAALCGAATASACGGGDGGANRPADPNGPVPELQIDLAVARLDALAQAQMTRTGVPGIAVAVVHGGRTVYAKGFGLSALGGREQVDADTVFQLASVSKSVGATVVAQQVGLGRVAWDSRIQRSLPWFELADPAVSQQLTLGDLYSHRSGLPDHGGDLLEELGFTQRTIFERLRYLKLAPFRKHYAYTNFGLTAAAEAVAVTAGISWAALSEQTLYQPLGMSRTSSRYADFAARANHAVGHIKLNGQWVRGPGTRPDAQSAAGGVSSSVNDLAKWLTLLLGRGVFEGRRVVDAAALGAALSPQMETAPASPGQPARHYGYGFIPGFSSTGRVTYSHSGAFAAGAATTFMVMPSVDVAVVVLSNGIPIGVPEIISGQFFDLVQLGRIERDWETLMRAATASIMVPSGALVGMARPRQPAPPQALSVYAGRYRNDFYGPLEVRVDGQSLVLTLGDARHLLSHWDGDLFTFIPAAGEVSPGSISKAQFAGTQLTLEYYNDCGAGTFMR